MKTRAPNTQKRRTELSQSVARIVICIVGLSYLIVSYAVGKGFSNQLLAITVLAAYLLYSVTLHIAIRRYPKPIIWRRSLTVISDIVLISYGFYLSGSIGGLWYPMYLWIIVGNGLRFGVPYLLFAMVIGVTCLTVAVSSSDYWSQHAALSIGLLIGIVVLPLFYVVVLRELETANLDLKKQKQAAEQANLAKSRFLAAASHDLRQPLQAQALFVADLYGRLHDPEKSLVILGKLDDSINAMREQFNALLDISKLDAGVVQPKIRHFKIDSLLNVIEGEYAQLAKAKGLEFRMCCRDIAVVTDPSLLDSVLRNLVVNALRYTHSGKVLIGCRLHSSYVSIEVWDTGSGIMKKHFDDIFQEFFQVGNPERNRDQGLGLGLSVVRRIANLLACPVHIRSTVGRGSCFSIDVPLGDVSAISTEAKTSSVDNEHVLNGVYVIVIDDERTIQEAMLGLLESWGCRVLIAGSGEDVLFKLAGLNITPDIIIADYRLPGNMTGVQAVAEIHNLLQQKIPAILITGDIEIEKLQDVQESAIPFLHKPIQPGRLRTLMQHMLTIT